MNFQPTTSFKSETHEGVSFVVRALNQFERSKMDLSILEHQNRIAEIVERAKAISDDPPEGQERVPREGYEKEFMSLDRELKMLYSAHVAPAMINAGLVSVEGLTIEGVPATVGTVLASGPDDLLNEIYAACSKFRGLTGEQQKN